MGLEKIPCPDCGKFMLREVNLAQEPPQEPKTVDEYIDSKSYINYSDLMLRIPYYMIKCFNCDFKKKYAPGRGEICD